MGIREWGKEGTKSKVGGKAGTYRKREPYVGETPLPKKVNLLSVSYNIWDHTL